VEKVGFAAKPNKIYGLLGQKSARGCAKEVDIGLFPQPARWDGAGHHIRDEDADDAEFAGLVFLR
jgi:hypothetical protein